MNTSDQFIKHIHNYPFPNTVHVVSYSHIITMCMHAHAKTQVIKILESAVNFYLDVNINIYIKIEIDIHIHIHIHIHTHTHIHGKGEREGDGRDIFSVTDSADEPFAGMYYMVQNLL